MNLSRAFTTKGKGILLLGVIYIIMVVFTISMQSCATNNKQCKITQIKQPGKHSAFLQNPGANRLVKVY